jgi:hypothetical protein
LFGIITRAVKLTRTSQPAWRTVLSSFPRDHPIFSLAAAAMVMAVSFLMAVIACRLPPGAESRYAAPWRRLQQALLSGLQDENGIVPADSDLADQFIDAIRHHSIAALSICSNSFSGKS